MRVFAVGCVFLLLSVGCNVGNSILVPRRDANATDALSADVTDVPIGDVTAVDGRTGDAPEVGKDAGTDVAVDAPADAPADAGEDVAPEVGTDAGEDVAPEVGADVPVVCGLGETNCSGTCRNLVMDSNHCGACDRPCAAGQVCSDAVCAAVCSAPSTRCGAECVLLGADERHCGVCGRPCAITETCSGGACAPRASVSANGCADETREAFIATSMFPNIAACAGGFTVPGVFPAPVRVGGPACATSGNNSLINPGGEGCSAADLCGVGWHICRGGEVNPATGGLSCAATTFPAGQFFAAAVSGPGCYRCALLSNTVLTGCTSSSCASGCRERNDLNNDLFGCGTGRASVECELAVNSGDRCVDIPVGAWVCPSDTGESLTVTKTSAAGGGVLCCRG